MREIVNLHVGHCGNQIGAQFWESLCHEHGINSISGTYSGDRSVQLDKINVFFDEENEHHYIPRSVFVDSEPSSIDQIKGTSRGSLFRPENFIHGLTGTSSNFAKGHYTNGADMMETVLDCVRKEIERCDRLHGFQLTHSLGGGTGSGLGALLLTKLNEEYSDQIKTTYTLMPSLSQSNIVVEPYNAVLSMYTLIEEINLTLFFTNKALYRICSQNLKNDSPNNTDANYLITKVMSSVSSSLRFPGELNSSLRKLAVNLVPFPRLHFIIPAFAPLICDVEYEQLTITELTKQLFDAKSMLIHCDPYNGNYTTAAVSFRGENLSMCEIEEQMLTLQNKYSAKFVDWIPHHITTSVCNAPPPGMKQAATLLANNSVIKEIFNEVAHSFTSLFRHKAFLHWYVNEGMDEMEFTEAESNMNDLVCEYQGVDCPWGICLEDEESDEEEYKD